MRYFLPRATSITSSYVYRASASHSPDGRREVGRSIRLAFFREEMVLTSVGLSWLIQELGLRVPKPIVHSEIVSGARKAVVAEGSIIERYPRELFA
jgi:hypothetical protein